MSGARWAGKAPIAVALDAPDADTAARWAAAVSPHVAVVKVGLELFCRFGPDVVDAVRGGTGMGLFLDLKLHDIPATVAGAARAVAGFRPTFLTVHASGGPAMVRAAVEAAPEVDIAAVTILTSLSAADLNWWVSAPNRSTRCAGSRSWRSAPVRGQWSAAPARSRWCAPRSARGSR